MRRWSIVLAVLAGCVLAGCVLAGCRGATTQLVVVVDTDLAIPSALDQVRVTVSDGDTRMASEEQSLRSASALPLTVSVVPDGDFLGPIDVIAVGTRGGSEVVRRRARVTLVRGESRLLRLDLVADCVGVQCDTDESCGPSGCATVDVGELPEWTGTPPRLGDAGPPPRVDAGDAGDADGGPPIACDNDADCDDGVPCTAARCQDGVCLFELDDSACDDGEPCTNDRCTATGCVTEPNTLPCDDGVFCNGFDRCVDGTCSMHDGDPCASPTVCDEAGSRCTGCATPADCPPASTGAWSACAYDDGCDESGTRTRTNRTYACEAGSCVPTDTTESDACARTTTGMSCGVGSCGSYGACDYADSCDQSATRTRTCTDLTCSGGVCSATPRMESMPCSRSTTGDSCGMTTCGAYGTCDYTDSCDETATRTRTCTDFACASGTCMGSPRMESSSCTRTTTGITCGSETCGGFGSCNYSSTCDESAQRSRTCTTPTCSGGSCSGSSMRTDTDPCTRDTDGTSCGSSQICTAGSCVSCVPTLSGNSGPSTGIVTDVSGGGGSLNFTGSMGSGTISASAGVTFSGTATTASCLWQVTTSSSAMRFTDFSGATVGTINVTGATLSGTANPPCSPSPYGCFPPCLAQVVGTAGGLNLTYSNGATATINFGCP